MSKSGHKNPIKGIKTGRIQRRASIAGAGVLAGSRMATSAWANMFRSKEEREREHKRELAKQAQYFADELGKLKGSVVKVGQLLALYGEHILPEEITKAFRSLEENTVAINWESLEPHVKKELGEKKFAQLSVDPTPIGAASLAQVHRATHSDGRELCLKIQYPGVAESIDSDLNDIAQLLRWSQVVSVGAEFSTWIEEVRDMLHREVDYKLEAQTTMEMYAQLKDDARFIVPEIVPELSTGKILTASYEAGFSVQAKEVAALSLARRNRLAKAFLELFFLEFFRWGKIQTDPNFGNYRIRIDEKHKDDQLVLLDFGAMMPYPEAFLDAVRKMIRGAYFNDNTTIQLGAIELGIMQTDYPQDVLDDFSELCKTIIEPLVYDKDRDKDSLQKLGLLNKSLHYCWGKSNLPKRAAKHAARSAVSKYFKVPPKEFAFLSRKLLGVFSFIAALNAEFDGREILEQFVE